MLALPELPDPEGHLEGEHLVEAQGLAEVHPFSDDLCVVGAEQAVEYLVPEQYLDEGVSIGLHLVLLHQLLEPDDAF